LVRPGGVYFYTTYKKLFLTAGEML